MFDALRANSFYFAISNEILEEYEEIIGEFYSPAVATNVVELLLNHQNAIWVSPTYRWNLIEDQDDNKFTDCAVACCADYIVTHDRHFEVLKKIPFPKLETLNLHQLKEILFNPK
jgi:uncharacterized protein